jgi:ribosomal protein L11 methyltransferase
VADQDWVQAYRESCHPVKVTDSLWVVPTWETPPDNSATNIIMDPGLAFGSGTHASTRLCLSWLAGNIRGGEQVVDFGCGSGILGIASLKLGAMAAWGADIDDQALVASKNNAALNKVTFPVYHPDDLPPDTADIVLANILANTLKELAPAFAQRLKPEGHIVLAGITADQAEAIIAVYKEWFSMEQVSKEEEWVCLVGKKK